MLAELDLDLSRLHFTGLLSRPDMVAVMRASNAHVYLTVPFVHEPAALAARIETALDGGDVLRRMRERARAKIVGGFDAQRVIWPKKRACA